VLKITAYSDRISVAPGEQINFMVSCELDTYEVEFVRIRSGDTNPAGPGVREEVINSPVSGQKPGRVQQILAGSYGYVPHAPIFDRLDSFTVQAMVQPTTPNKGEQSIIAKWSGDTSSGFRLIVDDGGAAGLVIGDGKGNIRSVGTGRPMIAGEWYFVAATFDRAAKQVTVYQEPLVRYATVDEAGVAQATVDVEGPGGNTSPLVFAGHYDGSIDGKLRIGGLYNGKIDSSRLANRALARTEMQTLLQDPRSAHLGASVVGAWDFSADIQTDRLTDRSANQLHGEAVNLPARAVTGSNWTGEEMCWRHAPEQWGAIHFHDDDLYDAAWQVDFQLTIPETWRSGVYAARLRSGEHEEYVPFAVRPPRGTSTSDILFLMPTASYMAYANEHFATNPWVAELMWNRVHTLHPHHIFLNEHREYGHSLYDLHSDGSGVYYSSRLRPILNLRPKVQSVPGGTGSSLWQFPADTHILDWLEGMRHQFDVLTDEDLHQEGVARLEPYRVVVTGTHPEYYSKNMRDAVYEYTQRGGRRMYLGGNGFYWRIAYHPSKPGVIEIRRAEGGSRAWEAPSGEYYMSFTGEYSGLWRRQGRRAPQALVGTGFTTEGFDVSSYYRRKPDSFNPRAEFIFEGIGDDELIGNFGLIGGGTAGLELDRYDRALGTPPHALLLASSENHTATYLLVVEDILFNFLGTDGTQNELVRGDIVFFETPAGGAVFSVSSMAWAGSLFHNNYDNNVSRLTENVLRRFLDHTPFEMPRPSEPAPQPAAVKT
jgi:N,N-dimethylformamidase